MTISIGSKIPSVILREYTGEGLQSLDTDSVFSGRKVVLFGVPGAFTPVCSDRHLPSYINKLEAFKAKGIDVVCMAVNDPFVMNAWAVTYHAKDLIKMLPDGNGELTKALGLEMDASANGLGIRCQRFALYAEDGVVKHLAVEKPRAYEVSSAEAMLAKLGELEPMAA